MGTAQLFNQALAVFEASIGESYKYTISTLRRMAIMYDKMGSAAEAKRIRARLNIEDGN